MVSTDYRIRIVYMICLLCLMVPRHIVACFADLVYKSRTLPSHSISFAYTVTRALLSVCLYVKDAYTNELSDVEDQAAKISVEEQMQITIIQNIEKDLQLAKSEAKQLIEDIDQRIKEKGQICTQILGNQGKISTLESDSSTLCQTLELIQQERVNLSTKLSEKSAYYAKLADDLNTKLQKQQVKHTTGEKIGDSRGNCGSENCLNADNLDNDEKEVMKNLDAAHAKFDLVTQLKSKLVSDNSKAKQSIELVRRRINGFKSQLKEMDRRTLEEELTALLSDKAGESEYLQSLHQQIDKLKGISHILKCTCGKEYEVEVDLGSK
ncbi:unnamed protein product [Ilex paraguariensis]|uniref:Uncharacterized protein n=1 Tax=Ilex paraguariensis TaxID=185542 RepID=A0ABC8TQ38_9AQUA